MLTHRRRPPWVWRVRSGELAHTTGPLRGDCCHGQRTQNEENKALIDALRRRELGRVEYHRQRGGSSQVPGTIRVALGQSQPCGIELQFGQVDGAGSACKVSRSLVQSSLHRAESHHRVSFLVNFVNVSVGGH